MFDVEGMYTKNLMNSEIAVGGIHDEYLWLVRLYSNEYFALTANKYSVF